MSCSRWNVLTGQTMIGDSSRPPKRGCPLGFVEIRADTSKKWYAVLRSHLIEQSERLLEPVVFAEHLGGWSVGWVLLET